jgi:phage terminase large subunit-like protein
MTAPPSTRRTPAATPPPARGRSAGAPPPRRRTTGPRVVAWIEKYCVHTNGAWIGKPFRLLPWQKRLLYELFEQGADGLRRYRWALIGVPKKNGKTELAAALGLYFLLADGEPAPLVVCAAASEDQADLVFDAAKTMCSLSPYLAAVTERFQREILVPSMPGAKLRRVAAAAGTNDGQNIHAVICDELHEWAGDRGENVWNVLTNATGARTQPMVLQITTAGYDREGTICGKQYAYGCKVQGGELNDPRFYFHWVAAPPESDYRDPAVWRAANPSYGVLVQEAFFRDQLSKKTESVFRRYFLNQWVASEEIWIPSGSWDACRSDLQLDPALPVSVGIDIARNVDSSALVVAQRQGNPGCERIVLRATIWANPYPVGHVLHESWRMNNQLVMARCRELREAFPVAACTIDDAVIPGPLFAYDPWRFRPEAEVLTGEGLAMVEFPQSDVRMVPASQAFFEAIMKGVIAHDGDPVLKRQVEQVTADQKPRGWRMSKPAGSTRKIDAAVAGAIACYCALTTTPPGPARSVYEDRGIVFL